MVTPSTVVRRAVSLLAVALTLGVVVAPPVVLVLDGASVGRLVLAALWVGVAGYALSTVARRSRATGDDERDSVWALVPRWQYTGRHVEFGGLTRDEQESALDDVREQAAARQRAERERSP